MLAMDEVAIPVDRVAVDERSGVDDDPYATIGVSAEHPAPPDVRPDQYVPCRPASRPLTEDGLIVERDEAGMVWHHLGEARVGRPGWIDVWDELGRNGSAQQVRRGFGVYDPSLIEILRHAGEACLGQLIPSGRCRSPTTPGLLVEYDPKNAGSSKVMS